MRKRYYSHFQIYLNIFLSLGLAFVIFYQITMFKKINSHQNDNTLIQQNSIAVSSQLNSDGIDVKHPPLSMTGAKGDGKTDDYNAIQKILDYAYNNNISTVFFPSGTYLISKPLLIKAKCDATVSWWDGKAMKLTGFDKATTHIIKTTKKTLKGVHKEVNDIDSTLILFTGENINGSAGGTGTGIEIKNIYIENQSNNTNSMAVTGAACQRMELDSLNIKAHSGIILNNAFSNSFKNIVFYCTEKALWVTGNCTSNIFINIYAPRCKNPYKIYSAYSNLMQMYADNATGIIFDVYGSGLIMSNCGTESPEAQYIVKSNSPYTVNILSLAIMRQTGDPDHSLDISDCSVFYGSGNLKVGVLSIVENKHIAGNSYLFSAENINNYSSLDLGEINYYKNYSGDENPKLLYTKQAPNTFSTGKIAVAGSDINVRRNLNMPYLGSRGLSKSLSAPFCDKAIYLDNASTTRDSQNTDLQYEQKYNIGDILLINDPLSMNILGYVVTGNQGKFVKDCNFAEIPIILRGSSSERPKNDLYIGLCFYDTTLRKPVWWDGSNWKDALGNLI